jgi:hypothetical protein
MQTIYPFSLRIPHFCRWGKECVQVYIPLAFPRQHFPRSTSGGHGLLRASLSLWGQEVFVSVMVPGEEECRRKSRKYPMEIILSRKDFDSQSGGWASPIPPDDRMLSLPIPPRNGLANYEALPAGDGRFYLDIMSDLRRGHDGRLILFHKSWLPSCARLKAHPDPDLVASTLECLPG